MKILNVVGARPNFMKVAPIVREMQRYPAMQALLVHTGQHYDYEMSKVFFSDLGLPAPDINLGVGSGSHALQTAKIMTLFEQVAQAEQADLVVVVGDVNSTLACSIVAAKLGIPIAHVEAGLRSFDRTMPEEINRTVTDVLSDYLFTTSKDANENLRREGVAEEKIFLVGNTMIDTLLASTERAKKSGVLSRLGLHRQQYALLTLHRPSNVDNREVLAGVIKALERIQEAIQVVFSVHPRTMARLKEFGYESKLFDLPNFFPIDPLGYLDFLCLMSNSRFVMTDSGGLQEETTFLQIPCLTLRDTTERPITVREGTNSVVGADPSRIIEESLNIVNGCAKEGKIPELWDGKAARRIVAVLSTAFNSCD